MIRFRTMVLFAAAMVCLAGGVLLLTPATGLLAQDKKPDVKPPDDKKRGPLDVGLVNLKKFDKADLVLPGKEAKVPEVDLRATISGQVAKDEKLSVYVAVNPFFGDTKGSTFWVQKLPTREGNIFKSECQFGEEDFGKGELFAVIAFTAKEDAASEGDQLDITAFSKIATSYSAVLMVQRKK